MVIISGLSEWNIGTSSPCLPATRCPGAALPSSWWRILTWLPLTLAYHSRTLALDLPPAALLPLAISPLLCLQLTLYVDPAALGGIARHPLCLQPKQDTGKPCRNVCPATAHLLPLTLADRESQHFGITADCHHLWGLA
jgi:hypothetical protein